MIKSNIYKTRTALRVLILLAVTFLGLVASSTLLSAASGDQRPGGLPNEVKVEVTGITMGKIPYKVIVVADPSEEECELIKDSVTQSLDRINRLMSPWVADSDVSRFNETASTEWFEVDAETAAVVTRANEISSATDGAFDITVGPAVNAWKFGPDKSNFKPLDKTQIESLLAVTGFDKLSVRTSPPALKKSIADLKIDLSSIAKGYAVDQVAEAISTLGYQRYLVEVGGEVIAKGDRANGGQWIVEVEDPEKAPTHRPVAGLSKRKVKLQGRAIATSGDYRNFYLHEGKRYSHTINPKTCMPVMHETTTASVVAEDCMTADAWATAALAMNVSRAHELAEANEIALLTLERGQDGTVQKTTGNYPIVEEPTTESTYASIIPTFLATLFIFVLAVVGMAVGAIVANKPVTGSCGGIASAVGEDGDASCMVCSKPVSDCSLPDA